jgi:hypothetical protein
MEPGPGVGGPGPGVIPPAGSPYGIYGGAVGRYGMGGGMIGGGPGGACATNMGPRGPQSGVTQASYNCPCEGGMCEGGMCEEGGPCDGYGGPSMDGGPCMRPGSTEAYADGAGGAGGGYVGMQTSQIAFLGDDGVQVSWDVSGSGMFDSTPLVIPGRQDFYQGAIYRLKLTRIPGRPNVTLYPTLEVAPVTPRTDAYLAHSPIPIQFTEEDFDQVVSGNFVTKVIYLPDPEFQELALAGVETLVSTRLDPGVDPIAEADRRGSILAIVRMGNKDLEMGRNESGTPSNVVPARLESSRKSPQTRMKQTSYQEGEIPAPGAAPVEGEVMMGEMPPMQVGETGAPCESGPACQGGPYAGGCYGNGYGDGAMANAPMGMPTSGFAPSNIPPNMIAGAPQWGMPITGTPIGLPGPPHVPLGTPAGLQKHVMKNRTKVLLPPPVTKMHLSVKQRPGLNYPRPVNHVHVDETQREPTRILPGWFSGMFGHHGDDCDQGHGGFDGSNVECPQ